MGPPVTPHNMFIRADSRLYRSQSSGCHGARRAARIASLYARDKRATGDPNLRSLHNCRSGGGGRLQKRGEGSTGGERYTVPDVRRGGEGGSHFLPSQNLVFLFCFLTLHVLVHIRLQHQERDHEAESGWGKKKRFELLRRPPVGAAVAPIFPYHSQQITQLQTIMCKQLSSLQPLIGSRLVLSPTPTSLLLPLPLMVS